MKLRRENAEYIVLCAVARSTNMGGCWLVLQGHYGMEKTNIKNKHAVVVVISRIVEFHKKPGSS